MINTDLICKNIQAAIINVALREEAILRQAGKGIFFMPELAFAYEIGKEIYFNRKEVLLDENFIWKREEKVESGIADLIFRTETNRIVIEFKILSKEDQYERDIIKLCKLSNYDIKLFCALEDVFVKNINHEESRRILRISKRYKELKRVGDQFLFSTSSSYKQELVCFMELWRVQ